MITACKAYITNNGSVSIWDQTLEVVTQRIKAAIHLNQVMSHHIPVDTTDTVYTRTYTCTVELQNVCVCVCVYLEGT